MQTVFNFPSLLSYRLAHYGNCVTHMTDDLDLVQINTIHVQVQVHLLLYTLIELGHLGKHKRDKKPKYSI